MNANELADYLDNNVEAMLMSEQSHIDQAATMLRQQQAEIEALKDALRMKVILNEHAAQSMKETKELLK
jgi:prophage DNA circulation protein